MKEKILVVDDEKILLETIEKLLTQEGYIVTTTDSSYDALDKVKKQFYDIIITDVRMPGMDGIALLKKVRTVQKGKDNSKIIIITAYANEDTPIQAIKLGADDYIIKPFELDQFLHSVKINSEILRLEKEKENHMEQLQELNKMKSDFLSITSHELRTPMTPIKVQSELLLEKSFGNINKKQEHSLKIIIRNTQRLERLIKDILDVSKLKSKKMKFEFKPTQLNDIISNTIENIESFIKKKQMKVSTKLTQLPKIMIDKEKIGELITNLCYNSIKFTKEKGKIIVETKKDKNNITVKISDNGIGIAKKDFEKIFEPFIQLDPSTTRKYGGAGLGLNICKEIMESHKGKIWVESKIGKGSTFYFSLPIKKEKTINTR